MGGKTYKGGYTSNIIVYCDYSVGRGSLDYVLKCVALLFIEICNYFKGVRLKYNYNKKMHL